MQQYINDIRPLKTKLRNKAKQFRRDMGEETKNNADKKICNRLTSLWTFRESDSVFVYMSTKIEVNTVDIIERAWALGKTVAIPRCVENTRNMEFYFIKSFEDVEVGSFGVLEPDKTKCELAVPSTKTLCIVPALMIDKEGYRLGYGKGYYDRFLSSFPGSIVGVCYAGCIAEKLPHGKFDRKLSMFITEKKIFNT